MLRTILVSHTSFYIRPEQEALQKAKSLSAMWSEWCERKASIGIREGLREHPRVNSQADTWCLYDLVKPEDLPRGYARVLSWVHRGKAGVLDTYMETKVRTSLRTLAPVDTEIVYRLDG